ncbi:protein mono-ADP-ribosyltransferase PARP3 [Patella vulgata]|uniref:protein mono-ADP-ribosyltransferase PARP3 n=1 Tax=Patella vulgata TaxID=6465 RepID=UPI0021803A10|nr:protein mono-ADP-ribosyltransferase PARP3 [Patella vulgata]XP_050414617.1 protein mono-ADP-ribosyltransferase PARP3 [Patella vulgata]
MPPKRKAAAAKKTAGGKKAKKLVVKEEEVAAPTMKDTINKLKIADKGKKKTFAPDKGCTLSGASVFEDYDCMLNQTNIGHNNNKFYIIQVLEHGTGIFYAWNRWGRVGESGDSKLTHGTKEECIKMFEKKFQDKTKNKWADREDFKAKPGKYTLIEMAGDDDEDEVDAPVKVDLSGKTIAESKLDKTTQKFMSLIFDLDMFKDSMKKFDIDVNKMPLGKLSKSQIAKGFEILDEIEDILNKKKKGNLTELSSRFYTAIPHSFGRRIPPKIDTLELVRQKMDMLMVLADIELAQEMTKEKDKMMTEAVKGEVPNPIDVNYDMLKCELELVDPKSNDFKLIETYTDQTQGYRKIKLQHVWKLSRDGDDARFKAHKDIKNRKLLWHGTNIAVVAAILKTGLRIMPHSGGRVGKGIYFASENGKSAGYVSCNNKTGVMFLSEVALGKEKVIYTDDHTLKSAPKGFDSVLAKGDTEPDPSKDKIIKIDGNDVIIPQGKPIKQNNPSRSNFSQSEYLVYKESQNRLRYMLQLEFAY